MEITGSIGGPQEGDKTTFATPKRIIEFITKILGKSKAGNVGPKAGAPNNLSAAMNPLPVGLGDNSGFFRTQHRSVL
jgi:hypothetical protein